MNNSIYSHYNLTISKDLISKFNYQNSHQLIKLNSFHLTINFRSSLISSNLVNFFILEWITHNYPILIKKNNTSKKKKIMGNGFKISLHKKKTLYKLLHKLIFFVLPNLKKKINFFKKNQFNNNVIFTPRY